MTGRTRGRIERLNPRDRSGFIRPDDGSRQIYVLLGDFRDQDKTLDLAPGDVVEYEVRYDPDGPRAVDVTVLDEPGGDGRVKGHIKWFSHEKRYGFISCGDGRLPDAFVHMNDFRDRLDTYWLTQGDAVEFRVEPTPKGPRAVEVVLMRDEGQAAP